MAERSKKQSTGGTVASSALAGVTGLGVGMMANDLLIALGEGTLAGIDDPEERRRFIKAVTSAKEADVPPELRKAIAGRFKEIVKEIAGKDVPIYSAMRGQGGWIPGVYGDPSNGGEFIVAGTKNPSIVAHEAGHARSAFRMPMALKNLRLAGLPIAATAVLGPGDDEESVRHKVISNAPALAVATRLPMVAEEGRAWLHALRGAPRIGIARRDMLKTMVPTFGTYIIDAATPGLVAAMALKAHSTAKAERDFDARELLAKTGAVVPSGPGRLTNTVQRQWMKTPKPPQPSRDRPKGTVAPSVPKMNLPSKSAYYDDQVSTFQDPNRGSRVLVG